MTFLTSPGSLGFPSKLRGLIMSRAGHNGVQGRQTYATV